MKSLDTTWSSVYPRMPFRGGNAGFKIDNTGMAIVDEVARHHLVFCVPENAFQRAISGFLDRVAYLIVFRAAFQAYSQIDDRNVLRRDAECHACQFSIQARENDTNCLGSTSGGRDDVRASSTASSPVFSTA